MTLQGKGWFIWQIPRCEGGSPTAIANKAVTSRSTHVAIKIAERTFGFGFDKSGRDLVPAVADALRAQGIQVWGWHYIYGENPTGEANIAIQRCTQLKLDGYIIDAETEFKQPGKAAAARTFMSTLRAGLPNLTVALSSFRYPSFHPQLPWSAFLEKCDLNMPQVYWEQSHNPDQQLARCVSEFANTSLVGFVRPVVPTGAAYGVSGWRATADDIRKFYSKALSLKLPAANLYSWDYATSAGNTDLWEAGANFDWPLGSQPAPQPTPQPQPVPQPSPQPAPTPQPESETPDIVERLFEYLNSSAPDKILKLYQLNAGHVTAKRTVVGPDDISKWYLDLLQKMLPGAHFIVTDFSGTGNSRHFKWTATGPTATVIDGEDTLGLLNDLIQYHYTSFTVKPK